MKKIIAILVLFMSFGNMAIANPKSPSTKAVIPMEEFEAIKSQLEGIGTKNAVLRGICYSSFRYDGSLLSTAQNIVSDLFISSSAEFSAGNTLIVKQRNIGSSAELDVVAFVSIDGKVFSKYYNTLYNARDLNITIGDWRVQEGTYTLDQIAAIKDYPSSTFQIGTIGGRNPDGTIANPKETFTLNYTIAPQLSMEISKKEDTITNWDKSSFEVKPVFTANAPYKVQITHDGKLDASEKAVTYTFADSNSSSVETNVLKYNERVKDTTISVTPNGLTSLRAGTYSDTLNLVVSMQ